MKEIKEHIGLGRLFAAPACICAVLLGVALGGHWSWLSAMVVLVRLILIMGILPGIG